MVHFGIERNIVDFSPRGVGQKVLDMCEYRNQTNIHEYSTISRKTKNRKIDQRTHSHEYETFSPRGLGHKVAGYLKYP